MKPSCSPVVGSHLALMTADRRRRGWLRAAVVCHLHSTSLDGAREREKALGEAAEKEELAGGGMVPTRRGAFAAA